MKPLLATAFASLLALLLPASASAQEDGAANSMGQPGQIAIHGDFELALVYQTTSAAGDGDDPDSVTTFQLAPAADFFVTRGLSLGGQLVFLHSSSGDVSADGYGAAPRVGYFAALGPKVGIWPVVSVGYLHSSVDAGDLGDASGYQVVLQAFAPILFQPVDHFFIGMGPAFQTDLIAKVEDEDADKDTAFGLQTIVGGYW